ncbi:hypothetical protein MPER_10100 [Moniliophthora perniciosa FA553]|nr:hypothetical protein MPER_10100 [Moniliophthora perniciosa FA553]
MLKSPRPNAGSARSTTTSQLHMSSENAKSELEELGMSSKDAAQFDPSAEARLRTKIDFYVIPSVSLLYLFCFIDRANIGNARLAGFERDLKLEGYDYNIVLTIFYISYIIFEIPSTMACKWIRPRWYIPTISLGFGIRSICTTFVNNIYAASGVRFLLGIFETGMLPGIA